MALYPTKSLDRNSRLSVALVKNRAEQNNLNTELSYLEKEKKTALRNLKNDKQDFRVKYSKSSLNADFSSDEMLSKYFIPSSELDKCTTSVGDFSGTKYSSLDFEEIHNMLFTNDEIDKEKILCLHLISAHRAECLTPPKKKLARMCKVHSPLERLLERSKRKNIHQEQRMTNMMPIYTIEITEFGPQVDNNRELINDGRLASRILLNERVRELINTVLNALRQSNPDKNYDIFEMANDASCLKKLFTTPKILDFLDDLMNCPLITSCDSFILTAPFRVKSIQLEIRTISGTLETLVKQVRQNVLQIPSRAELNQGEHCEESKQDFQRFSDRKAFREMSRRISEETEESSKDLTGLYSDKSSRRSIDPEKKFGRHADTNFVQKNKAAAACTKKVEYDSDDDADYYHRPKRSSVGSSKSSRRSSEQTSGSIIERPNIQPIRLPEEVVAIMEEKFDVTEKHEENDKVNVEEDARGLDKVKLQDQDAKSNRRRSSTDSEHVRIHLKQTTCPACMERYKIPLPPPKTPRVKPSSVLPSTPGEDPSLKTNSQNRISSLINKEMFKLQSYERRFSTDESSRKSIMRQKEMATCSSSYLNLTPLELAKIEQEIREKETQKKLEKFLKS